jgi:hypothetical protein
VYANIESIKVVMREYYGLLCDGFEFYSTWDDVCEEAKIRDDARLERHKRRDIRKRRREKAEAERRALVRQAMSEKDEKLKKARECTRTTGETRNGVVWTGRKVYKLCCLTLLLFLLLFLIVVQHRI